MPVRVRLGEHDAAIVGDGGELVFDLARGTFDVLGPGGAEALSGATARVVLPGGESHALTAGYARAPEGAEVSDVLGRGMELRVACDPEGTGPGLVFAAACYEGIAGVFVSLACANTLAHEIRPAALDVILARGADGARVGAVPSAARARLFRAGAGPGPEPFVDLAHPPKDLAEWARAGSAGLMGCLAGPGSPGACLLLGFVTAARQPVRVDVGLDPGGDRVDELAASCELESRPLPPGAAVRSERLFVTSGGDPLDAIGRYGRLLGRSMKARIPPAPPSAWRLGAVAPGDAPEELRRLAALRERLPLRAAVVGGGSLEAALGCADEMRRLAEAIREAGFEPGLAVSPFDAPPGCALARAHAGWLVRGADGGPLRAPGQGRGAGAHVLDGTHPEVQAHLEGAFRTVVSDWGFARVEIELAGLGAPVQAVFHDPRATRIEACRRGLEAVRRGAGEGAFVTVSGAPFGPCVGVADCVRVSPDGDARARVRSAARRWFFGGTCWRNDAGPVVPGPGASDDEARTLAAAVGLLGGAVSLPADAAALPPARAAALDALFPAWQEAARPLDLFEGDPPSVLALAVERPWGTWLVALAVNWADDARPLALDLDRLGAEPSPARHHVFDASSERYLGCVKGSVELGSVPPGGSRLVAVRRALGRPELLSTTLHLTQGGELARCEWRGDARTLALGFGDVRPRRGRAFVHVPEGFARPRASGSATVASSRLEGEVLVVDLDAAPGAALEIAFE